jgi:hypothetical protein
MWLRLPMLAAFTLVASLRGTTLIMPDFANVPAGWNIDRYDPHSFSNVGAWQGRDNVLGIDITSAEGFTVRPAADQSTFDDTQGRNSTVSGGADSALAADLYIPSAWSDPSNGSIRTDMWGVMTDGASVTDYPIIGFTNYGGPARYRVWEENTGAWVDLPTPVAYDAWTAFEITFTGSSYIYSIDNTPVYTDTTVNGSTGFSAAIMQAYNFYGDPSLPGANAVDYTAHWSNAALDSTPEPGTWGLLGGGLIAIGLRFRRPIGQPTGDAR